VRTTGAHFVTLRPVLAMKKARKAWGMATKAKFRLPATVLALGFTSLFTDIGTEMAFPLLPAFLATLGAGPAFLGIIEGVADATAATLKYWSGRRADRVREKKPLVLLGYGLSGGVRPLLAFALAPWHVLGIRVVDRVGKGLRSSPRDLLITESVPPEETGRAFGFHQAMDHAGAVVGPLLATGLLALGLTTRSVFAVALVPGVLALGALLTVKEPPAPEKPPRARAPDAPLPTSLLRLFAIFVLFALGNSSDAFLLLRARSLGISELWLPILWVTLNLSRMGWNLVGGGWADRFPKQRLLVAGWLVYAAVYLAFAGASQPWHVWALFVAYGAFYGLTEPVEKALVRSLAPEAVRGRAFGLLNMLTGLTAIPAGLVMGGLWQAFGPEIALATGAGLALTAAALLGVVTRGRATAA
jgi:MFS family permease